MGLGKGMKEIPVDYQVSCLPFERCRTYDICSTNLIVAVKVFEHPTFTGVNVKKIIS